MPFRKALSFDLPAPCDTCPILEDSLCLPLPEKQRNGVRCMARGRLVPQGQPIFEEGEEVGFFASILTGVVKLFRAVPGKPAQIVTFLYPPQFLGYSSGDVHRYSAAATTEVELCIYPRSGFHSMLEESGGLRRKMLEKTDQDLELAREWVVMLSRKSSYQRVAGIIAIFAQRTQRKAGTNLRFFLPVSRADLAAYLGMTLETVSRNITILRQKRLIELRSTREVVVPHIESLLAEADMLN